MWPHKDNLERCLHCSEQQVDRSVPRLLAENCGAAAAALRDTFATPSPSLCKQDKRQEEHPAAQLQAITQNYQHHLASPLPVWMRFYAEMNKNGINKASFCTPTCMFSL